MRALIIFLILVLCGPAFAQRAARYDSLDVKEKLFVGGINRTAFFSGLTVGNKVPGTLLADSTIGLDKFTTAAYNFIGSGGSVTNNPDDVTLENKTGSTIGLKEGGTGSAYFDAPTLATWKSGGWTANVTTLAAISTVDSVGTVVNIVTAPNGGGHTYIYIDSAYAENNRTIISASTAGYQWELIDRKQQSNIFNVVNWGADPSDTQDDALAIENMFAAVGDGATVYMNSGEGQFIFGRDDNNQVTIVDKDNLTIIINGNIKLGDDVQEDGRTVRMFDFRDCDYLKIILNGEIDGNYENQSGWSGGWGITAGVVFNMSVSSQDTLRNIEISGGKVYNHNGQVANTVTATGVEYHNVEIDSVGEGMQAVTSKNVKMYNNKLHKIMSQDGLEVAYCDGYEIYGNVCDETPGSSNHYIDLFHSINGKVHNNIITKATSGIVAATYDQHNTEIYSNRLARFQVPYTTYNFSFHHNTLIDSTNNPVCLYMIGDAGTGNYNVKVEDNIIKTAADVGLSISGNWRGASVSRNHITFIGTGSKIGIQTAVQGATNVKNVVLDGNEIIDFQNGIAIYNATDSLTIRNTKFLNVTNKLLNSGSINITGWEISNNDKTLPNYFSSIFATNEKIVASITGNYFNPTLNYQHYRFEQGADIDSIGTVTMPPGAIIYLSANSNWSYYVRDGKNILLAGNIDWQMSKDEFLVLQLRTDSDSKLRWHELSRSKFPSGVGTFTTTATNDTTVVNGATTSSRYLLTPKYTSGISANDVLSYIPKTDSLIVVRPPSGTSGLLFFWTLLP